MKILKRTAGLSWILGLLFSSNALVSPLQSTRPPSAAFSSHRTVVDDDKNEHSDDETTFDSSIMSRRQILQTAATSAISLTISSPSSFAYTPPLNPTNNYLLPTPIRTRDVYWPTGKIAFSLLPLAGTSTRRKTLEQEIVKDQIWTHDQIQGIVNVNVPVRQTVVRLSTGELWIHNPVAPTPELVRMMERLVDQYGPVRHIVLGTVALEHKATFPAFCSYFPNATAWIQPGQWSFPINLPIEYFGLSQRGPRLRELPQQQSERNNPSWTTDLEYEVLGPLKFQSVGGFSETAFFHKTTQTLIVTDICCSVTQDPPLIIAEDPRALLYHARDSATEIVHDNIPTRQKGWRRMVQFGLVFFPSQIQVRSIPQAIQEAQQVPSQFKNLGDGAIPFSSSLYPWAWPNGDSDLVNFQAISQNGKLFCPPILTKLILDREPDQTLEWVDRVCQRFGHMKRILPSHLNNDIRVNGGQEFSQAFDPLRSRPDNLVPQRALAEDLALLQKASDLLTQYGIVAPSQVCDGEPARRQGRFARQA